MYRLYPCTTFAAFSLAKTIALPNNSQLLRTLCAFLNHKSLKNVYSTNKSPMFPANVPSSVLYQHRKPLRSQEVDHNSVCGNPLSKDNAGICPDCAEKSNNPWNHISKRGIWILRKLHRKTETIQSLFIIPETVYKLGAERIELLTK